jgi:hypothetical protein
MGKCGDLSTTTYGLHNLLPLPSSPPIIHPSLPPLSIHPRIPLIPTCTPAPSMRVKPSARYLVQICQCEAISRPLKPVHVGAQPERVCHGCVVGPVGATVVGHDGLGVRVVSNVDWLLVVCCKLWSSGLLKRENMGMMEKRRRADRRAHRRSRAYLRGSLKGTEMRWLHC